MLVEGVQIKGRLLDELRETIRRHRQDDRSQLTGARRQRWSQWDERLKRLAEWSASGAALGQGSDRALAWKNSILWFDRAARIGQNYRPALEKKLARLEKQLFQLGESVRSWSDRLILKEAELRGFLERETVKGMDILISSARKRPLLDFVYAEREEEARLAREFKSVRGAVNLTLGRFAQAEKAVSQKALAHPGYFENRKNSLLGSWEAVQKRFYQLREETLNQALSFEEGRRRLRWVYDTVQRLRVVHETPPLRRRPLLERLFKSAEN